MNNFLRDGKREAGENPQRQQAGDDDVGIGVNASEPQPQLPDKKPSVIDVEHVENLAQLRAAQVKTANALETKAGVRDQSASSQASNKCKGEHNLAY